MPDESRSSAGRSATFTITWTIVLGCTVTLCALIIGLLELTGLIAVHAQRRHPALRQLPLPVPVMLALVYGLIPMASAVAFALGMSDRRRRHEN